jgi:ATP-dependent DNA ligase
MIGKRTSSKYQARKAHGSVGHRIKVKLHQEQEFIIGGYTDRKDRGNILALCWWFL